MSKYGRHLRFGYCPLPNVADPKRPLRLAALAETLGLDYIGIQDHPYNAAHFDAWTLLTAIGMTTSHISLFTNVAGLPLRSPMLLAKAAASLDLLTGGRVEVGLGAQGEAAALEEAMQVMRLMWGTDRPVRFEGKSYQLAGLDAGPAPAHRIGLWLSANDPQTLALAGRFADGWISSDYPVTQPGELAALSKQVDEAAAAADRNPAAIQRIWNITGRIGNDESGRLFQGSAKQWAESLAEFALEAGIDTFMLMGGMAMEGDEAEEQLHIFATEVVPHTRGLVDAESGALVSDGLSFAQEGFHASGATPSEEEICDVDLVDETSMESFPASDPPASASFT